MSDLRLPELNKVFIAGRLTRDPELRYLSSGSAVCSMGIAVTRHYRTKDGEKREETLFVEVETWNKSAEYCGENLKKGRPVLVEGSLKSDEWEDKEGRRRTLLKVNAIRVNALDWDPATPATKRPEPAATEDDIPF